jgi:hypothetical protein
MIMPRCADATGLRELVLRFKVAAGRPLLSWDSVVSYFFVFVSSANSGRSLAGARLVRVLESSVHKSA